MREEGADNKMSFRTEIMERFNQVVVAGFKSLEGLVGQTSGGYGGQHGGVLFVASNFHALNEVQDILGCDVTCTP